MKFSRLSNFPSSLISCINLSNSSISSLVSRPNWYQIGNKTPYKSKTSTCYIEKGYICQQAWKCHLWHVNMCYRPQYNVKGQPPRNWILEVLKLPNWNIPTDRACKVDEKNAMLTSGFMVIKMSKMAPFLYFLLMYFLFSHSVGKIFTCLWKILLSSFRKGYG